MLDTPVSTSTVRPIAITQGDPAGIGPEIIAKAFRDAPAATAGCFVAGDVATLRRAVACISGPGQPGVPVALIESPDEALTVPPRCIPVLQVPPPAPLVGFGQVSAFGWKNRRAMRGVGGPGGPARRDCRAGDGAIAQGSPDSSAGVPFPGHTELLQAEAAAFLGKSLAEVPVRMMLANDELRTVLVSIHVSLRDAIEAVTFDNVLQTVRITHESVGAVLRRVPRIGRGRTQPACG